MRKNWIIPIALISLVFLLAASFDDLWAIDSTIPGKESINGEFNGVYNDSDTIPFPWNRMDLSSEMMKPGYPFVKSSARKFPWLPVSLGAVGGGVATILLLNSDKGNPSACELTPIADIEGSTCGRPNGSISLTIPDETDITYKWENGAFTPEITQLIPGNYLVTITKGEDKCRTIKSFVVPDNSIFFQTTLEVTDAVCGVSNGSIQAETHPDDNYEYMWSNGSSAEHITGLTAGSYSLTVSLGQTCENTYQAEVIELGPAISVDYTVTGGNCQGGGDIILDISNGVGSGNMIVKLDGPSGMAEFELPSGSHSLGDLIILASGNYTVSVFEKDAGEACAITQQIVIPDETPDLNAVDDQYQTPFETILEENILENDSGFEIAMINVKDIIGGDLTWSDNGDIVFKPSDGFSGEASFAYMIQDACDTVAEAVVKIEVLSEDCDFTITSEVENASCGFSDGMVSVEVNEPGNYRYEWENGQSGPELSGVLSGTYTIFIEEVDLGCILDFQVTIEEDPAEYYRNLYVQAPHCVIPGDITFEVSTPGSGPISMEILHPNGDQLFIISPGVIFLSDYVPMVGGQYKVILFDESIGMECSHDFTVELPPIQIIEIALDMVIPPSSPMNMDGAIFCSVVDPGEEPYQIFLNGQFYGSFSGSQFVIEGLGVGEYTIWIADRNGCTSNEVNALLIILMDPSFIGFRGSLNSSKIKAAPEHPGVTTSPSMPALELFFNKALPVPFTSMEIGIGLMDRELRIRSDLRWQRKVTKFAHWDVNVRLASGISWSSLSGMKPYLQLGPSLQKYCYPGALVDLEIPARRMEGKWQVIPTFSVQIPLIEKFRK